MEFFCDDARHVVCVPYSIANLHKMAVALGLKYCWFHHGKYPHYDIPKKRIGEIKAKCKVVSTREILRICKMKGQEPWIGVDLDGTLAQHPTEWIGATNILDPIPSMVDRVKKWLADGKKIKIFTARASLNDPEVTKAIEDWCVKYIGVKLEVTCSKDFAMVELWDDRCVQVIMDTGRRADGKE